MENKTYLLPGLSMGSTKRAPIIRRKEKLSRVFMFLQRSADLASELYR